MTLLNRIPLLACVATLSIAFAASPARADDAKPPAATAEQLAEQAYEQHAAGKDAEAISTYLRAYELSKASALLFNVATIYDRKLRERGLAEDFYRRYLAATDAEPDLVRKATERLTALKKEDDAEAAAKSASITVAPIPTTAPAAAAAPAQAEPVAAPPPSAPASSDTSGAGTRPLRTAGFVVGAVGVASIGTSLVLGLVAKGKNDDANAICNGAACTNDRGVTLAHDAGTFATVSTIAFVSGLALVGAGVTMIVLAPKSASASSAARFTLTPQVGLSQVGLNVGGSF